jgi:hypothetical protein
MSIQNILQKAKEKQLAHSASLALDTPLQNQSSADNSKPMKPRSLKASSPPKRQQ